MKNALTIDLEFWYSPEYVKDYFSPNNINDQLMDSTNNLVQLLDKYDTKATFFVLGTVAEKYPELIKMLYDSGHEIASHSYSHMTLDKLGKDRFEEELNKSTQIIKSITKEQPIGFRAPSFSINKSTSWAFQILEKYGYKYDSSIFPIKTMLYGVPDAPTYPYRPDSNDIIKNNDNGKIIEFPLTTFNLIKNIPISGGFYFRLIPSQLLHLSIGLLVNKKPIIIYLHPWETHIHTPRLDIPMTKKIITYYGINSALNKMDKMLNKFEFGPVREVLGL